MQYEPRVRTTLIPNAVQRAIGYDTRVDKRASLAVEWNRKFGEDSNITTTSSASLVVSV